MHPTSQNYGILVSTRNRPHQLNRMLDSVLHSSLKPKQVIIISSGDSIDEMLRNFELLLPITHKHIEGRGQIRQKIEGVKLLAADLDWVAFFDDDILLERNAIHNIFETVSNHPNPERILGVGLATNDLPENNHSLTRRIFTRFFGINENKPGGIQRNGQNNSYMSSSIPIETSWLNGASIWRRDIASNYNIPHLKARYSICEDLIFSYPYSKQGILLFNPGSKFSFQEHVVEIQASPDIFRALTYWRLYFVSLHSELSKSLFLWSQVGRTLQYMISQKGNLRFRLTSASFAISILADVFLLVFKQIPSIRILELRQSDK